MSIVIGGELAFYRLSFIVCRLFFTLYFWSSFVVCHLVFVVCCLLLLFFCRQSKSIRYPQPKIGFNNLSFGPVFFHIVSFSSFVACHLSFVVCRLSSVFCRQSKRIKYPQPKIGCNNLSFGFVFFTLYLIHHLSFFIVCCCLLSVFLFLLST